MRSSLRVLAVLLPVLATACAAPELPPLGLRSPLRHQFDSQYEAQEWDAAAATVALILAEYDLREFEPDDYVNPYPTRESVWHMAEAAERGGKVREAAIVLGALGSRQSLDAPFALAQLAKRHGDGVWDAAATMAPTLVPEWRAVVDRCARGEWRAVRAQLDAEPRVLSRFLLGDLLREAGQLQAALVEYTIATWDGASSRGRSSMAQYALGCVRIEAVLYDMGEPLLASQAMEVVNRERAELALHAPSQALDQRIRTELGADARRDEVFLRLVRRLPEPAAPDLAAAIGKLAGFAAPVRDGEAQTFRLQQPALAVVVEPTAVVVRGEGVEGLGEFRVDRSAARWHPGLGYHEFLGVGKQGPRCLRLYEDGALFVGSAGFDSYGVFCPVKGTPIVGAGHFGRPIVEGLTLQKEVEYLTLSGGQPRFGVPRRRYLGRMADGTFFQGEGYQNGDRLIPDGPVWVGDPGRDWYTTEFRLGEPGVWRQHTGLLRSTTLAAITDVRGERVALQPTSEVLAALEPVWREIDARNAADNAAREAARRADEIRWQRIREGWERSAAIFAELDAERAAREPQQPQVCSVCSGTGRSQSNAVFGQRTYYVQDTPGSPLRAVTVARHDSNTFQQCPACRGSGKP